MDRKQRVALEKQRMVEIYRSCRLCGAGGGYKMPIIQQILPSDIDVETELKEKIRECVSIAVSKEDKMPPLICELCVDKVNDFYEFREMCLQINMQTRTKLGLPPQAMPSGSGDAGDCILGLTSQVYINPKDEEDEKGTPKSKGKSIPKITIKKEDKGWNKSVERESPSTRSSRHSRTEVVHKPGPKSSKKITRSQREPTPPPVPEENNFTLLRSSRSRSKICTPSPSTVERSSKRSLDRSVEPEPKSAKKVRIKAPSPSPPPPPSTTRTEKRRSVTFSPAASPVSTKKSKQATPDKRTDKKQEKLREKDKQIEKANEKRHTKRPEKVADERPAPPTCNLCGQTCTNKKGDLTSHLVFHHSPTLTSERMSCAACREWFVTVEDTVAHHKWHRSTGAPYKCANCQADYRSQIAFNRHIELGQCIEESVVPDVRCEQCWNYFATPTSMSLHTCGGVNGRPGGSCCKCSKKFARYKTQLKHEETCTGKGKRKVGGVNPDNPHLGNVQPIQVRVERCDSLLESIKIQGTDGATGAPHIKYDVSQVHWEFGYDKNCVYPYISSVGTLRLKTEEGYMMDGMKQEIMDEMYDTCDDDYVDGYSSSDEVLGSDMVINPFAVRDTKSVEKLSLISLRAVFSEKLLAYGNLPKRKRRKILKSLEANKKKTSFTKEEENKDSQFDSLFRVDKTDASNSALDKADAPDRAIDNTDAPDSSVDKTDDTNSGVHKTDALESAVHKTDAPDSAVDKTYALESAVDKTDASNSAVIETDASDSAVDKKDAPNSTVDKTDAPESAVDETDAPYSTVNKTDAPESSVYRTETSISVVNKTAAPDIAVNATDAPDSAVDTTYSPDNCIHTTGAPDSAIDKTDAPDSVVDTTDAPDSAVDTTEAPDSVVDTTDTLESALNKTCTTQFNMDKTDVLGSNIFKQDDPGSAINKTVPQKSAMEKEVASMPIEFYASSVDENMVPKSAINKKDKASRGYKDDDEEVLESVTKKAKFLKDASDTTYLTKSALDETDGADDANDETQISKTTYKIVGSENITNHLEALEIATNILLGKDAVKTVSVQPKTTGQENDQVKTQKSDSHENIAANNLIIDATEKVLHCEMTEDTNRESDLQYNILSGTNDDIVMEEETSHKLKIALGSSTTNIAHTASSDVIIKQDNANQITREIDLLLLDNVSESQKNLINSLGRPNENIQEHKNITEKEVSEVMETEESDTNNEESTLDKNALRNELLTRNDTPIDENVDSRFQDDLETTASKYSKLSTHSDSKLDDIRISACQTDLNVKKLHNVFSVNKCKEASRESLIGTSYLLNTAIEPEPDVETKDFTSETVEDHFLATSDAKTDDLANVIDETSMGVSENSEFHNTSDDSNEIRLDEDISSKFEDETENSSEKNSEKRKVFDESDLLESNVTISQESSKIHTDKNTDNTSCVLETLVSDKNEISVNFEDNYKTSENIEENSDSNLDYGDEASLLKSPERDETSLNDIVVFKDNALDKEIMRNDEQDDILKLDNISDDDFDFD